MKITFITVMLCFFTSLTAHAASITKQFYGYGDKGQAVDLYTLKNNRHLVLKVMSYRGIIVALKVPDRDGASKDIVLGHDTLAQYQKDHDTFFGAIVGRYANRIAGASFSLDGHRYTLPKNDGNNSLHSGLKGMNNAVWTASTSRDENALHLKLRYVSPDGEQGFPGQLTVTVTYSLNIADNKLTIDYQAETSQSTYLNLTNHAYYNLSGEGSGNILQQEIRLNADQYTPTDKTQIPTGEIASVQGTPLDLRKLQMIGRDVFSEQAQIKAAWGYDHNFVLNKKAGILGLAAEAYSPLSGIDLKLYTTQPAVQFYSGNHMDNGIPGKNGHVYGQRGGFALETQHFPDSMHHANFPSVRLDPKRVFHEQSIYVFSTQEKSTLGA
jgi:aldose 1-epimerase